MTKQLTTQLATRNFSLASVLSPAFTPTLALSILALLAGCASLTGGDRVRSSPVLRLTDARVTDTQAALQIEIENPSDFDLTLTGIDYELIYGPLPVAEGLWSGRRSIAPGETINISLPVGFDQEPSDTTAPEVELRGSMMFGDRPGAESLNEAPFSVTAPARR